MKIAMIMLAAGNSRRFGSNKLLYPVDGVPMYRHVFDKLMQVREYFTDRLSAEKPAERKVLVEELSVTVVTQYEEIYEYVCGRGAQALYNPKPDMGISSSVKIGLNANQNADAVLFCVADQPWLRMETIEALIKTAIASGKGIACVSCDGSMGNPCLFKRKYFKELLALEGDKGGKKVIRAHREDTAVVEISDTRELLDMDFRV